MNIQNNTLVILDFVEEKDENEEMETIIEKFFEGDLKWNLIIKD